MAKDKIEFLNPFDEGVSYAEFLEQVGKKTIAEYCKDKLTDEQIAGLEIEVEHFNKK